MKKRRIILITLVILTGTYFLGPQPDIPIFKFSLSPSFPKSIEQVNDYITNINTPHNIKPNNESHVYWAAPDSITKTEYAIVYLHGFSASPGEGIPIHTEIAKEYGMNLYVPRLASHGLVSQEPLLDFDAASFINSAYEALKVGELIGEKVIVMSCSTGGTASLYNVAFSDASVFAQIMYSPNIQLADPKTELLTKPWGLQIARIVKGGNYHIWDLPEEAKEYWYGKYRLEAVVELQNMIENSMTPSTFEAVSVPSFIGYYYKDEENQDATVSVSAMKEMIGQLGTENSQIKEFAFTEVGVHAIQSGYFSKDVESVIAQTEDFLENILEIKKPAH